MKEPETNGPEIKISKDFCGQARNLVNAKQIRPIGIGGQGGDPPAENGETQCPFDGGKSRMKKKCDERDVRVSQKAEN